MSITLQNTQFLKTNLHQTKNNKHTKFASTMPSKQQNVNFAGRGDVFVKSLENATKVERLTKAKRVINEAAEFIGGSVRRLGKDGKELPVSKKPKIAKSEYGDYPAYVIQLVKDSNIAHPDKPITIPSKNAPISVLEAKVREVRSLSHHENILLDDPHDFTSFGGDYAKHLEGLRVDEDHLQITEIHNIQDLTIPDISDINDLTGLNPVDLTKHTDGILGDIGDFMDHFL